MVTKQAVSIEFVSSSSLHCLQESSFIVVNLGIKSLNNLSKTLPDIDIWQRICAWSEGFLQGYDRLFSEHMADIGSGSLHTDRALIFEMELYQ